MGSEAPRYSWVSRLMAMTTRARPTVVQMCLEFTTRRQVQVVGEGA